LENLHSDSSDSVHGVQPKQSGEFMKFKEIKVIHNTLAARIKEARIDKDRWTKICLADEFRHRHIAYCLLRGRTMQQIENKNHQNNEPKAKLIEKYKLEYAEPVEVQHEETLCAS
jgi:hypothetical protein